MTHMLSAILAKVTSIEKLLAPAIHNLPDSEILDSKGVRLLTKMSDRTLLRRRNDGSLPFHRDKVHIPADTRSAFPVISVQSPVSIQCCWQS